MRKKINFISLSIILILNSCTIGWNEFKTEKIVSDFYVESMDNDLQTLVLKENENDNSGIIIASPKIFKIGHNKNFIAGISCCDWTKPEKDTTYFIIDISQYNEISWFQKFISSSPHSEKVKTYEFKNEKQFSFAYDSLITRNKFALENIE